MEKVIIVLDYANINKAAQELRHEINYRDLLGYLSEGRFLVDAHAFVPIDPRNEHRMDQVIEDLWLSGYIVHSKVGTIRAESYVCSLDVELAIQSMCIAHQVKPDIIVLATGDADCLPVVIELRKMGIRVEVASFQHSAAREMILKSSGFIRLDDCVNPAGMVSQECQEYKDLPENDIQDTEDIWDQPHQESIIR